MSNPLDTLEKGLHYHLKGRFYPPIPTSMVQPCVEAITLAQGGDWSSLIDLPEGILFRGVPQASVYDIIEAHRLEDFLDLGLCEMCESNEKTGGKYCDSCREEWKS